MPTPTARRNATLAGAIAQGLRDQKRTETISSEQTAQVAADAAVIIRNLKPLIGHLMIPHTKRAGTAVALLTSSLDHGDAICALLATERPNYGASTLALHRAQTEQFLRGAFFAQHATDDEIEYFRNKGKLRRRQPKAEVSAGDLADLIGPTLGDDKELFSASVVRTWKPLCGYVHGGTQILDMYMSENIVGAGMDVGQAVRIVRRTLALAMITMVVISRLGDANNKDFDQGFRAAHAGLLSINDRTTSV